jgi:hypothetical protein
MMDLQQHYNNYTTLLYMRVGPSVWSPPHVKGCCVIVVVLLCRNQTPLFFKNKLRWETTLPHRQGGEKLYI